MVEHYLLVAADTETVAGRVVPAYEVATARMSRGVWYLYRRTPNRARIAVGDRIVAYAAGSRVRGMCFVGAATVVGISVPTRKSQSPENDLLVENPVGEMSLGDVTVFEQPPSIRAMRDQLAFVPSHNRWGAVLQGGCKSISADDYNTIIRWAQAGS